MKKSLSHSVLAGTQAAWLCFCLTAQAQMFQADFNDGQVPTNSAVYGAAQVGADGSLHLTDAGMSNAFGVFAIELPGAPTGGSLDATWRSRVGGGSGADGYSFNWAGDLPAVPGPGAYEEGVGSGLSVTIDTWDSGLPLDPGGTGLEIKWRGNRVAFAALPKNDDGTGRFLRKDLFVEARVTVDTNGHATFTYDGVNLEVDLPGFAPIEGGRFLFAARTSASNDNHWVDEINVVMNPLCLCFGPFFTPCPTGYVVRTCGATTNFVYPTPFVFHSCPLIGFGIVCTPPSGSPFPVGPTVVTCTASDCLTTATCKFTVTVLPDTTKPVLDCSCLQSNANGLLVTNGCLGIIPNLCQFTNCFSDNCCLLSCSQSPLAGTVVGPGTHPIIVTITDCALNATNCELNFVVNEPPGGCDTNCLVISNEDITCVTTVAGKLNYTFDVKNNTSVPIKYLFLVPKTSCFIFMPDIITFNPPLLPGQTTTVSVMIQITGNCSPNLCFIIAAHDAKLVACCSSMHCIKIPSVPSMVCRDVTVDCDDDSGALVNYPLPTANSPCCPGPVSVTCNPPPGWFPLGITPVTCTAIDSCSNTVACSFSVIVLGKGAGQWTWARQSGALDSDAGTAVAVDGQGNVYVTGVFDNLMTFPAGPVLTGFGGTGGDVFLAKYNSAGVIQWAVRAGGTSSDVGFGVAVDQAGNAYITGEFTGANVAFESYPSTLAFTLTSLGGTDIFVAKYDPNGACLWAVSNGATGADTGTGVAVAANGNVFVTGNWTLGVPQPFLMKLNGNSGAILNTVVGSGPSGQVAQSRAVAVDGAGDPYMVGSFISPVTFTPFAGCTLPGTANGARIFAFKFNGATLTCLWAVHSSGAGATGNHDGTGIAVDPSGQFCYLTAYFNGTADFGGPASVTNVKNVAGPGQLYDYLITQFNAASGLPNWAIQGGGNVNADEETRGIAVDPFGNPCITGFLQPNAPGPFINAGQTVLVARYSPAGVLLWTGNATDGAGTPNTPANLGFGIAVDRAGCVHVTGAFTEDLDFPPLAPFLMSNPNTVRDMFVAKECPVCCTNAQVLNLFSGRDTAGLLPNGAFDPQFTTAGAPLFTTANPYVMDASAQNPAWVPGTPNSQWIGPNPSGTASLPGGVYIYTNRFFLCSTNQAAISGRWTADNDGEIRLNGQSTGNVLPFNVAFQNWSAVSITSGFQPGWNTLTFHVQNAADPSGPTGLRTELTGTACCVDCLTIACPTNIVRSTCGTVANVVYPLPTVTSTCSLTPTVTCLPPGPIFPLGPTTVQCTATDALGHAATCSFTVTVLSYPPLAITCPPNQTHVVCYPPIVANYSLTTAGGAPPVTVTCSPPSGTGFPFGVHVINCSATDGCGVTMSCAFTVTVQAPVNPPCIPIGIAISGTNVVLSWPADVTNVVFEATDSLNPSIVWRPLDAALQEVNGHRVVTLPISLSVPMQFFRLRSVPARADFTEEP